MKLTLYQYVCFSCKHTFKAPEVLDIYGFYIMRSYKTDAIAYLNTLNNVTMKEFDQLFENNEMAKKRHLDPELYQFVLGICCDLAPDGSPYGVIMPKCKKCHARIMESWEETHPAEYTIDDIYPVLHTNWNALTLNEKNSMLNDAIFLYTQRSEKTSR